MSWLLAAPLAIPLATAILCLLSRHDPSRQRRVSLGGAVVLVAVAGLLLLRVGVGGIIAGQAGGWPAPYGITLVADHFSALMVLATAVMALAILVYARADLDPEQERLGFHPLYHALLTGAAGAFLTGDLFNLYVWFEVMLIAAFGLLALGAARPQLDATIKYAALNLVATALILLGVGLLYGLTGTLNLAALALRLPRVPATGVIDTVAMLLLIGFGLKAALFPLFAWLPASYHTPTVTVTAIFSTVMTKAGVYVIIRLFTLVFIGDPGFTHQVLLWIGGLTMVSGVLGAVAQTEIRRLLAFHIISQIGYMIIGLGLLTPLALIGSIFYTLHNMVVKTNLFLIGGVISRLGGGTGLKRLGGLYRVAPGLSALFLISALSLAGVPPSSGFWGKWILVRAGLEAGTGWLVAAALGVGLLTLFSMTKIWGEAFWKPHPAAPPAGLDVLSVTDRRDLIGPIAALVAVTVVMGLGAAPLLSWCRSAAGELLEPAGYIAAVLGAGR